MRTLLKYVSGIEITGAGAANVGCKTKCKPDRATAWPVQVRCRIPIDPDNPDEITCVNCGLCSLRVFSLH